MAIIHWLVLGEKKRTHLQKGPTNGLHRSFDGLIKGIAALGARKSLHDVVRKTSAKNVCTCKYDILEREPLQQVPYG